VKFHRRAPGTPRQVAVFPGSFNPPTAAHVALAKRATEEVDEVIFVLPETFPHKDFSGVGFEGRLNMLLGVAQHEQWSVASTQGGLFIDMARELQPHYADATCISFAAAMQRSGLLVGIMAIRGRWSACLKLSNSWWRRAMDTMNLPWSMRARLRGSSWSVIMPRCRPLK